MEKLIKDYEELYRHIASCIQTLEEIRRTETLRAEDRDRLTARINTLEEERFDLIQTIYELKQHR